MPKGRVVKHPAFVLICRMPVPITKLENLDSSLEMLRLDLAHPFAQGNKHYKLKYNVAKAKAEGQDTLLTFGGPWSNHLHATALTAKEHGFQTIGIVRGEEPKVWSPTLKDCREAGMELYFISRAEYRERTEPFFKAWLRNSYSRFYLIPEGGSNYLGVNGCMEILDDVDPSFDIICCAAGTGATASGLALKLKPHQQLWVFPAMGEGNQIKKAMRQHLYHFLMDEDAVEETMSQVHVDARWSMGGFGKTPPELQQFMDRFQDTHHIQLDRVYTGKMMWGVLENIKEGTFNASHRILAIHTGGTQGNRGLMGIG